MDIVLALKKKWLDLILSGEKIVEVRRVMPAYIETGDYAYLYHKGQLHGRAKVNVAVWLIDKENIRRREAERIAKHACLSADEIMDYWKGSKRAGWIAFDSVHQFDDPIKWQYAAPQNFVYSKNL